MRRAWFAIVLAFGSSACARGCRSTTATCGEPPNVAASVQPLVGSSRTLVPLCGGRVLVANTTKNQLELWDVSTQKSVRTWPVASEPGDVAYDAVTDTAYVALDARNQIATLHPNDATVTEIAVDSPALHFALGADGTVFASLRTTENRYKSKIAVLAPKAKSFRIVSEAADGELLAFDNRRSVLVVGESGLSPSSLHRYAYDAKQNTLAKLDERRDACGNGKSLAISPDGNHLAFTCGSGNAGGGYVLSDFDPTNLQTTFGNWKIGAYPTAAMFSADSKRILATNGEKLVLFDVATHAVIQEVAKGPQKPCVGSYSQAALSPGGTLAFAITTCLTEKDTSYISWAPLPL